MSDDPVLTIQITYIDGTKSLPYAITTSEFTRLSKDFNNQLAEVNRKEVVSGVYDVIAIEAPDDRTTKLMLRLSHVRAIG